MGIYDRDYGRDDYDGGKQVRFTLPAMTALATVGTSDAIPALMVVLGVWWSQNGSCGAGSA